MHAAAYAGVPPIEETLGEDQTATPTPAAAAPFNSWRRLTPPATPSVELPLLAIMHSSSGGTGVLPATSFTLIAVRAEARGLPPPSAVKRPSAAVLASKAHLAPRSVVELLTIRASPSRVLRRHSVTGPAGPATEHYRPHTPRLGCPGIERFLRSFRRCTRPHRQVGEALIVARPHDGAPLHLNAIAALLWQALSNWTTESELSRLLELLFPDVGSEERATALNHALNMFAEEGLLDFGRS